MFVSKPNDFCVGLTWIICRLSVLTVKRGDTMLLPYFQTPPPTGWVRKNGHRCNKHLINLFVCRFFEIFSKQPIKQYKCKTLESWISGLWHFLTSKAVKISINTAICAKVIKLKKEHLFVVKRVFLVARRLETHFSSRKFIWTDFESKKLTF